MLHKIFPPSTKRCSNVIFAADKNIRLGLNPVRLVTLPGPMASAPILAALKPARLPRVLADGLITFEGVEIAHHFAHFPHLRKTSNEHCVVRTLSFKARPINGESAT